MADSNYMSELEKNYPRIVERITLLWGHSDIASYLGNLVIDARGDRKGFSFEIMTEIMLLNDLDKVETEGDAALSGKDLWDNPLVKNLKI